MGWLPKTNLLDYLRKIMITKEKFNWKLFIDNVGKNIEILPTSEDKNKLYLLYCLLTKTITMRLKNWMFM